jgi:hypothetical protein
MHHLLRRLNPIVTGVLTDLRGKLAAFYSDIGRPSIDPELMIRMLSVPGRSESAHAETKTLRNIVVRFAYWQSIVDMERAEGGIPHEARSDGRADLA